MTGEFVVMTDLQLFTAAGQGDLQAVQDLLQAGLDVNQGDSWTGDHVTSLLTSFSVPSIHRTFTHLSLSTEEKLL